MFNDNALRTCKQLLCMVPLDGIGNLQVTVRYTIFRHFSSRFAGSTCCHQIHVAVDLAARIRNAKTNSSLPALANKSHCRFSI